MFRDNVCSLPADRIPNTVGVIDPLLGGDPEERHLWKVATGS